MLAGLSCGRRLRGKTLPLAAFAIVVIVSGCGSDRGTPLTQAAPSTTAAAEPSTSASTIPGDPVPTRLRGTWQIVSIGNLKFTQKFAVAITDGEYWLKGTDVHGDVVTNGQEIDFYWERLCDLPLSQGIGRYRWQIDGKTLKLRSIEKDPCSDRSGTLDKATLRRVG